MKQPKPKLNVRVRQETVDLLARHPRRAGVSRGAVVDAAILTYCSPERGEDLVLQRLDQTHKRLDRFERDQRVLAEMIGLYVRYYLSVTPQLSEDAQRLARQTGGKRFDQFVARVTERVAGGGGAVADIVQAIEVGEADFFTLPRTSDEEAVR